MSTASYRRASNDVKVDINTDEDDEGAEGGLFTSQSDIEEESEIDLNDPEVYLRQPLVPNERYRGTRIFLFANL